MTPYGEIPDQATLDRLKAEWGGDLYIYCRGCGYEVNIDRWARHRRWHVACLAAARSTVVDVERWLRARLAS